MQNLPSQETVKTEILKELDNRNVPRMCSNCVTWDRATSRCNDTMKLTHSFMFCPKHMFKTEKLEREAMEYMKAESEECGKIENLLALAITSANVTSCFIEDFENRTKKLHKMEKDKRARCLLRKDLDMGDELEKGMEDIKTFLEKIDQRFRFYIQPHIDRMFTEKGKGYNVEKSDGHLNNSLELGRLLVKFVQKCIGNQSNSDKVFDLLDSLTNDTPYALTDKDAARYKLKM